MLTAAVILFVLHALIAGIDGVYFHLFKYRLYARRESLDEHVAHTLRGVGLALGALLLFALNAGGLLLWAALIVIALDVGVQSWDVLIEKRSRKGLGGLSPLEYLVHTLVIMLYAAAYTLVLAAKPPGAFAADAPLLLDAYPQAVAVTGWTLAAAAALGTVQHIAYLHPKYRAQA